MLAVRIHSQPEKIKFTPPNPNSPRRLPPSTQPKHPPPIDALADPESAMTELKLQLNLNPRKHGIDAAQLAIHPEEVLEFNEILEGLFDDLRPNGELQRLLFGQVLHAHWNMRIARKKQAQLLLATGPMSKDIQALSKFFTAAERSFHKALAELRAMQTEFAYRVTLAQAQDRPLPNVPPLVRTSEVHKQVRRVIGSPAPASKWSTL